MIDGGGLADVKADADAVFAQLTERSGRASIWVGRASVGHERACPKAGTWLGLLAMGSVMAGPIGRC